MKILSSDFPDKGAIPSLHTCESKDLSPALEWSGAPGAAKSFVLIMDDPDAPGGTWLHWLVYDIPAATLSFERGADLKKAKPIKQGINDFSKTGYGGPCPPRGHGKHRYYFKLMALDVQTLGLEDGASLEEVEDAVKGHVLAEAGYMGTYMR